MTGNEKDYTAVLLEDVNSNMKAFWEVLLATQDDVKGLKEKGDATFEQVGIITERLVSLEFKLDDLIKEVSFIKEEIKTLKISLSAKTDKEKLETLEFKIIRIEKYLKIYQ